MAINYSQRDDTIRLNSYTTVLRRRTVPHEDFAAYWRDVHGPLCSRIPGLGWYVQQHFAREQDAHLWPSPEGIGRLPGYVLDGAVEIGFGAEADQQRFQAASPLLFGDEQNVFGETVAYDLPHGSTTHVDRQRDAVPNGRDPYDRVHVHLHARAGAEADLAELVHGRLSPALAAQEAVVKVRTHAPERRDDDEPRPPAPNVAHDLSLERRALVVLEIAFSDPLSRRRTLAQAPVATAVADLAGLVTHVTPFAVSGVFTFVRDGELTPAGVRGSRPAALISRLAALNQLEDDVVRRFGDSGASAAG